MNMNDRYRHDNGYDNARIEHYRRRTSLENSIDNSPPAPYYPPPNPNNPNVIRYRPGGEHVNPGYQQDQEAQKEATFKNRISQPIPIFRLFLDLVLVLAGLVPVILLNTSMVKPFERGFYCDDESIRYPLSRDTITPLVLYTVGAAIVAVTMITVEIAIAITSRKHHQLLYSIRGKRIPTLVSSLYIYGGYCLFGFMMVQITTDICKHMVGRLRPHFIEACDPDWSRIRCTENNYTVYVTEAFCRNQDGHVLRNARLSFLSGHSSYSTYMMGFLALYLQARWRWPGCSLMIKHILQFGFIAIALLTSLSRISDYRHHWSDVLAGAILGILGACLTALHIGHFFEREKRANLQSEITTSYVMSTPVHLTPEQGYKNRKIDY